MRRFDTITLEHEGQDYVVEPRQVMGLIDAVEEHVTLGEIVTDQSKRGTIRFGKLSQAYASALRYAGAKVTDEEIYISLMPTGQDPQAMQRRSTEIVTALLQLMVPPEDVVKDKDQSSGNE